MPKKRYNAEEIIHKLREADVLLSQGKPVSQACKQFGVSDQTYYRWRKMSATRIGYSESLEFGSLRRFNTDSNAVAVVSLHGAIWR
jgi:transposase-like protein